MVVWHAAGGAEQRAVQGSRGGAGLGECGHAGSCAALVVAAGGLKDQLVVLESDRARACFVGRSLSSRPLALSRLCTKDCAPLAQSTQQAYSRRPDQQSDPRKPYSPRPPRLVRQHPRLAIRASHLDSPTARSSASPPSVLSLSRADPDPSPPFSHARRRRPLTARRLHHRHGPGRRRRPRHPPRPRIARPPRPLDHAHARQLHLVGRGRQPR